MELNCMKKFLVATDPHGDQQDKSAVDALFKFIDIFKPDLRICAGDLWDFRPLRGKASDDEKRESMREDFTAGETFFNRLKPHYFLRGNHDERLWELAERDEGVRSDYALDLISQVHRMVLRHKCKMLPYHKRDGVLRLGSLKILHGFSAGVNAARQTALIYGSCLFGHVHTIDQHAIPGLERRVARSIGCLCKLDMDYNAKTPSSLRHAHGWAYGVLCDKTGRYFVNQAESIDGKWILPSNFIQL